MWKVPKVLRRSTKTVVLLTELVRQQKETNLLLRELTLKLTGHRALTPSRQRELVGSIPGQPNLAKRNAVVWTRTSLTEMEQLRQENLAREKAAAQPFDDAIDSSNPNEASKPSPTTA